MCIFKVGKFEYIDIWHVLSQKKKKKKWQVVEIVGKKLKKKMAGC